MSKPCPICLRPDIKLTQHHLIPRSQLKKKYIKKKLDVREARLEQIALCRSCHNHIHAVISEREMATEFNSLEKLLSHPEVHKYATWVRDRNIDGKISVRRPKV